MKSIRRSAGLSILGLLIVASLLPWLLGIGSNRTVPRDIVARPTDYQATRIVQLTTTAMAEINAAPTVVATSFDIFSSESEGTPSVDALLTTTPIPKTQ